MHKWMEQQLAAIATGAPPATRLLVPLMDLFERMTAHCFRHRINFFVDSGTLLGCIRHGGIIPWDYDADVGMLPDDYQRFRATAEAEADFDLDLTIYGDPKACYMVKPRGEVIAEPYWDCAFVDVVRYGLDGRSMMDDTLQRNDPLDCWRTRHSADSYLYDFPAEDLASFVPLHTWCGRILAPVGWKRRLDQQYDNMDAAPAACARAVTELGFDPLIHPARPLSEYATLEEGMAATAGKSPFVVRGYREPKLPHWRASSLPAGHEAPFDAAPSERPGESLLLEGERYWWFVSPDDASASSLRGRSMTDIVSANNFQLWGRVGVAHQRPGDLVVFPATWSQRTITYEAASVLSS